MEQLVIMLKSSCQYYLSRQSKKNDADVAHLANTHCLLIIIINSLSLFRHITQRTSAG